MHHRPAVRAPRETVVPTRHRPASSAAADARPPRSGRQVPVVPPSSQQPMPGCRWRPREHRNPSPERKLPAAPDDRSRAPPKRCIPPISERHPQMIEVENLSKRYGTKLAVDGLNFVVQPGIVTGFLGPNGSGTVSYTHLTLPTK